MAFKNRLEAGRLLSQKLRDYQGKMELSVSAVSPGGAVIGRQLASFLGCPLQTKLPSDLKDKTVIVCDDGAITGKTMIASLQVAWQQCPKKVVAALPVLSRESLKKIEAIADEVVYLELPEPLFALSQFYEEF